MRHRLRVWHGHNRGSVGGVLLGAAAATLAVVVPATLASSQVAGTGAFVIDKVFEGDALLRGAVTIAVSCSNGREESITIAPDETSTAPVIGGLTPGTRCTVTEPVDGSSAAVAATTTGVPTEVVADATVTPTVRIVNTYAAAAVVVLDEPPGSLTVTKVLQGDADLRGDIEIRVRCDDGTGVPGRGFDQTQTVPAAVEPVRPLVFAPIPAPSDCAIAEPVTGENDAVDAIVIGETTVRVTPNTNDQVTLINNYTAKSGSLRVRKVVAGSGAALRGTVLLDVSCSDGTTSTLVVPPGQTTSQRTVAPIVAGSQCTVTETASGGVAGVVDVVTSPPEPQTVTIADGTESVVEVRDTYAAAMTTLGVTKVVAGPAAGSQGPVVLEVICNDGTAATFTVPAATPAGQTTFPELAVPFGTTCAVAETATGRTATVDVTTTFVPDRVVDIEGPTTLVVTNAYTPAAGRLVVTKAVAGDGAGLRGPVTINAVCDGTLAGTVTYPPGPDLAPLVVSPLPAGASCTVTETDDGAVPGVVDVTPAILPADPVLIPAGATATVTVTNTYTSVLGSLTVVKQTEGNDTLRDEVTIAATCTPPGGNAVTETRTYPPRSPLAPLVIGGLPAGTVCVVSEPDNGASPALAVTTTPTLPLTITIGTDEHATVTITNTYAPVEGSLTVVKDITGTQAGQHGPIEITATCDGSATPFSIPAGALTAPPFTLTGMPAGTTCIIDEPVDGDTPSLRVTTTPTPPLMVTIPAGGSATATVTNQYEPAPASLTVTKTITGTAAAQHGFIAVLVDCGPEHSEILVVPPGDVSPSPVELTGIPAPTTCTLTELLDGETDTVGLTTSGAGEVPLAAGQDAAVTLTDEYQPRPASLVLTKIITGDAAAQHGPIQITATCNGTTTTFDISAGETLPATTTIDGITPGTTCTIAEPSDGSTAAVAVSTWPEPPVTVGPFAPGGKVAAAITDNYTLQSGRLLVAKDVSGPAAGSRGNITITVVCSDGTTADITYTPTDPLTTLDVGPLPFGTTCVVAEPATGATDEVVVDGPRFIPGAVVTIDASFEGVAVANDYRFASGTVELVKAFDGPAAAARGPVRLRWTCSDRDVVFDIPPGDAGPVTPFAADLPAGTTCWVIELNNGATPGVAVATGYEPPSRTVTAAAGQTTRLTVTNTYTPIPTGALLVESTLTGPAEPRRDTVQLTISCDSGRTVTLTVPPGQTPDPALVGGLPTGTRCTIAQPRDGDTPDILTTTSGLPTSPIDVTVGPVTVLVTNVYTEPVPPPTTAPPPITNPPPATSPDTPTTQRPSPTPAPKPPDPGATLPATGATLAPVAIAALVVTSVGISLRWPARRRRRHNRPPPS